MRNDKFKRTKKLSTSSIEEGKIISETNNNNTMSTEGQEGKKPKSDIEQQHKEFKEDALKAAETTPTNESKIAAEPIPDISQSPNAQNKIISETVVEKITSGEPTKTTTTPNPYNTAGSQTKETVIDNVDDVDDFNPEPPPEPLTADPQIINPTPPGTTSQIGGGGPGNPAPFTIPSGMSGDAINQVATMLNYALVAWAPMLFGIKKRQEYYKITALETATNKMIFPLIEDIENHNAEIGKKLEFTETEIRMIREPLVEKLGEDGIKGLSADTRLIAACVLVASSKVKVIVEIKASGKKIETNCLKYIADMEARLKKEKEKEEATKPKEETKAAA